MNNNNFRYGVVVIFAILAFLGPLIWAKTFSLRLADRLAQQLRSQLIAEGKVEEASQLSSEDRLDDFGVELSPEDLNQVLASELLLKFWWLWGLLIVGCSYGIFVGLGYFLSNDALTKATENASG
ncbi:MAG: hypothetical protein V4719_06560 [Planctomycetota bacterium]